MSVDAEIEETDNWFISEKKDLLFTIDTTVDPSTWAIEWSLKPVDKLKDDALIDKATPTGITIDGTKKQATVHILAADTSGLEPGKYFYTLKRMDAGSEQVLAFGGAVLRGGTL